MFLIRDIMYCKPGKVRDMVAKFAALSGALKKHGLKPFRILTDISAERYWTVVAESEYEKLEDFMAAEGEAMSDPAVQEAMAGYHDLVDQGRREIYRIES